MKLLFSLILVLFLQNSFAETYYISPAGNDETGTGSQRNPWKTLYKAASAVTKAGNTIHVKAGIYIETRQIALAVGVSIEGEGVSSVIKSSLTDDWKEILLHPAVEGCYLTENARHRDHIVGC